MIQAVIYDMDGIIIDSEPHWRTAEVTVFGRAGAPLTWEMTKETMGLRIDEVVEYWAHRYPIEEEKKQEVEDEIMEHMVSNVKEQGELLPGLRESLEFFKAKGVVLALASSSQMRLIDAVLERFALYDSFSVVYSAENEQYGKPHPGVYLTTAEKLGIKPAHCLAIEDSMNGILSAKAAKMQCIAIPDNDHRKDKRLGIADVVVSSLSDIDEPVWERVNE